MRKIKVSLGNIDEAIRQLNDYEKKLKQNVTKFMSKLLETGVDVAKVKIVELGAIDSGELESSMQYMLYREGNKGVLFTECTHAAFVEFGTGVKGSASPHPTLPWSYDTQGHGEDGWYYYDTEQGRIRFTKGMPSRPFMYETSKELEQRAIEIAKEVFSR